MPDRPTNKDNRVATLDTQLYNSSQLQRITVELEKSGDLEATEVKELINNYADLKDDNILKKQSKILDKQTKWIKCSGIIKTKKGY